MLLNTRTGLTTSTNTHSYLHPPSLFSQVEPVLRYALVVGAPLMILVGGTVGALAAALLAANPIYQVRREGGKEGKDWVE